MKITLDRSRFSASLTVEDKGRNPRAFRALLHRIAAQAEEECTPESTGTVVLHFLADWRGRVAFEAVEVDGVDEAWAMLARVRDRVLAAHADTEPHSPE